VNALPDETTVELARAGTRSVLDTPSIGWIPVTQITAINDDDERLLNNINQRSLAVRVTLNGSAADATVTPEVESYTVRAYPGEGDLRVSLQVNVSDQVARFGKNRSRVPNRGSQVFNHLLTLAGTATSLTLLKEGLTLDGTVEQVSQPISTITPRGSSMLVSTVVFRGRESSLDDDVSIHTWGSGQWGQGLWGLPGEEIA
ncbi:MAG: hypothetical protein R3324_16945, partial [Halobacteriales archaeon]|nr:hypothetical protein [Halobacteriales archaeon]